MRPPGYAPASPGNLSSNLPPGVCLADLEPESEYVICPVCGDAVGEFDARGTLPGGEVCCPGCEIVARAFEEV